MNAFLQLFSRMDEAETFKGDKFVQFFYGFLIAPGNKTDQLLLFEPFLRQKYPQWYNGSRQQDPSEVFNAEFAQEESIRRHFIFGDKDITIRNTTSADKSCKESLFKGVLKSESFEDLENKVLADFKKNKNLEYLESEIKVGGGWGFSAFTAKKYIVEVRVQGDVNVKLKFPKDKSNLKLETMLQEPDFYLNERGTGSYYPDSPTEIMEYDCRRRSRCLFSKYIFITLERSSVERTGGEMIGIKIQSIVDIPEQLTVEEKRYVLFGHLNHLGDTPRGGHWTATVRNESGQYTTYNDENEPIHYKSYDEYVKTSKHVDQANNRDDRTCLLYMRIN